MKKSAVYITIFILALLLTNCKDEYIGQFPVDKNNPQPVKNVVVENLPGKVKISYELPDEKDLLYVQGTCKLSSGVEKIAKTSVFSNSMIIEGFGKSEKMTLRLIAVDRSQNKSTPVDIEIEPLDSPIYEIFNQMKVIPSFGGLKISWSNPEKIDLMVGVLKQNKATGELDYVENFYSSLIQGIGTVRGQDSIRSLFAIYIRDTYMNYTDTLFLELQPFFEEEIPKNNFIAFSIPTYFKVYNSNSVLKKIWDGNVTDETNYNFFYIRPGNTMMPYFTFDLGITAKLSRFRLWPRLRYAFTLHSPKEWEWYGTNNPDVAKDAQTLGWEENPAWVKIMRCESKRPSGLNPGDALTTEDLAYINEGEEFEFPLEIPPVRYLRFKLIKSWSDGDGINLQEVSFWGQIIK